MKKRRILGYVYAAVLTSFTGFFIHVLDAEILEKWSAGQPAGMTYSLPVTLLAAFTSIEIGIGLVLLYGLVRPVLKEYGLIVRGVIMAALLLAIRGSLLRQPLMDQVIGEASWQALMHDLLPWRLTRQALMRDLVPWLTSVVMCLVLVWADERFIRPAADQADTR